MDTPAYAKLFCFPGRAEGFLMIGYWVEGISKEQIWDGLTGVS
jgi:hypothetical protein